MKRKRLYLSPPHLTGREKALIVQALDSGWITSVGPQLDEFERRLAARAGVKHAVGVSSGTAALHLSLLALGVGPGDDVICSTLTFAASANPIVYQGARPVFIDSDYATWNMDPNLLEDALRRAAKRGKRPRAVIVVDLYGQCAALTDIRALCRKAGVPLIEDAAEALGATHRGRPAGSFGWANIFSFNGNKIITTSGGGMLATDDGKLAQIARHLSTQARDTAPHYEHTKIGFNYRLSNILAALGLAQLAKLDDRVAARRRNFEWYRAELGRADGLQFMPESSDGTSTRWLTCVLLDPSRFGADRERVRLRLESKDIEARPIWKPMHLQPVFRGATVVGGRVSEDIFRRGLCLPSGSALSRPLVRRVSAEVLAARRG
ncbi:MAG: aminotransferase class I/II-fold pyridoxal phosphate-dependent enzyme [Elusimicrobia bacterium]|nr:aminotransferase class I/II-fold pyridoxal phosphate-dependent enzyme [Elusimicrobiota bacterium]